LITHTTVFNTVIADVRIGSLLYTWLTT